MANSMYMSTFNNQMAEMLEDVLRIFPENPRVMKCKMYFEGLKKTNPRIVIQSWKIHVAMKYKEQIQEGHTDFFIHTDFTQDVETSGADTDMVTKTIREIKSFVSIMNDEQKNIMMIYIQNLTKLSLLYV